MKFPPAIFNCPSPDLLPAEGGTGVPPVKSGVSPDFGRTAIALNPNFHAESPAWLSGLSDPEFRARRPKQPAGGRCHRARQAFSLVEVLVVVSLLSLIVLALMAVFNSTQRAFRAGVTQSDVLESGRATVDLITRDLHGMTPSGGVSNVPPNDFYPVNFFVVANTAYPYLNYAPLVQKLPGSSVGRTNLLNFVFILGRENTKWTGTGYIVDTASTNALLYPLYRFYAETNIVNPPGTLYSLFADQINNARFTNMSHLVDGVVHLNVHAFDREGRWIQNVSPPPYYTNALNTYFLAPAYGEPQFYMFSNTVPASVELELGLLEDQAIRRAESLPNDAPALPPNDRRTQYLQGQSGSVHVFRQRVSVPNFDSSAYQ